MQSFLEFLENSHEAIPVVHNTTPEFAASILQNGFNLRNVGNTAKRTGQSQWISLDPEGIFLIRDHGNDEDFMTPHPFDHKGKGVRIYAWATLRNPLEVGGFVWDQESKNTITYKIMLSRQSGGKSGRSLTQWLIKKGHDGIVTDGEVVVFDPAQITINREKTLREIHKFNSYYPGVFKKIDFEKRPEWFNVGDPGTT